MRRLVWLTLILLFVSGAAQAAPQFSFRAKPRAHTHATAKKTRVSAAVRGGAFHRVRPFVARKVARRVARRRYDALYRPKIKAKLRRRPTDLFKAMDPRLAALTKTLLKAERRAKKIGQAAPRWASATNRIKPGQGAKYQQSVGRYVPLGPKQFAASLREKGVPRAIAKRVVLVDVEYRGYDGKTHQGQIVVHKELRHSIARVFHRILTETDFPIRSVIPVSDKRFGWRDSSSVAKNNSSGFNFRLVSGSLEVSDHAFGTAVDINPKINPWAKGGTKNRTYNPSVKGTLDRFSKVVKIFKQEGWKWGGDWKKSKDWQHFYWADIPKRDFGKREVPE